MLYVSFVQYSVINRKKLQINFLQRYKGAKAKSITIGRQTCAKNYRTSDVRKKSVLKRSSEPSADPKKKFGELPTLESSGK